MDKKEAILRSVLKLVSKVGFYHLNMKSIAQEAGVAAGTIYLYFKGKEDLINALYSLIVKEFNEATIAVYEERGEVKANFYAMMEAAIAYYVKNPYHFSFVEQYTYAPFLFKDIQDLNFQLLLPIYKMMGEGKKQQIIKNLPDAILLSIIHGGLNTLLKLHLAKKVKLDGELQHTFYDAIWQSISQQKSN